jgi:hypothetical protein
MVSLLVDDEFEKMWEEAVVAKSTYYPSICLAELRKMIKNLSQDSLCPTQKSNQVPTEYESKAVVFNLFSSRTP